MKIMVQTTVTITDLLVGLALLVSTVSTKNWDFNYDFTGFSNRATLLVTNCTTDVRHQINMAWGGRTTLNCIEEPTTNQDKPHVSCVDDAAMGKVINFTLYRTDDDSVTGYTDRQRLEMKVFEPSPTDLKATNNTHYIYTWWLRYKQTITTTNQFYHIMQLKAVGAAVDDNPLFTISMTTVDGLHIRIRDDDFSTTYRHRMLPMNSFTARWIQVYVEVRYMKGKTPGSSNSGYVKVMLKDQNGMQLYPTGAETGLFYGNMYWDEADFIRPKWGLYRAVSPDYQPSDWQLFQNVQIWKKN